MQNFCGNLINFFKQLKKYGRIPLKRIFRVSDKWGKGGKPEGKSHWGNPDVDGRIILRWIYGKWEEVETGWSWLRIGTDGGHL